MDDSAIAQVLSAFNDRNPAARADIALPLDTSGITDPHVASLAMPVFGTERRLIGALALSGPSSRLTRERADALKSRLRESADRLSSELEAQL